MKIILYHSGIQYPNYLLQCIRQIKNISPIPVILLTDRKEKINEVEIININELKDENIKKIESSDYFHGKCGSLNYPEGMWRPSCFRLFYIENYIKKTNLQNSIHFDNDVLIFKDPLTYNIPNINKILITPVTPTELVFGYSVIPNHNSLHLITEFIFKEIMKGNKALNKEYDNYPTEMKMMSKVIHHFEFLPIIPKNTNDNKKLFEYYDTFTSIFDPATYGQIIDGTWHSVQKNKYPKWTKNKMKDPLIQSSYITPVLRDGKNTIKFIDKIPYIQMQNEELIKINNLHIHTKQLEKFI